MWINAVKTMFESTEASYRQQDEPVWMELNNPTGKTKQFCFELKLSVLS